MVTPFLVANAATAAAGAAKGAAKIALGEKAAKSFAASTKSINKAYESGALQSVENIFGQIQSSQPVLVPMQVIMADLKSATTVETMGLIKDSLTLIATPGFQAGITVLGDIFGFFLKEGADAVGLFGRIINGTEGADTGLQKLIATLDNIAESKAGLLLTGIAVALRDILSVLESLNPNMQAFRESFSNNIESILRWLGAMFGAGTGDLIDKANELSDPSAEIDMDLSLNGGLGR